MALSYQTPFRTRERIMTFGVQGTGKSTAPLDMARKIPDSRFYVVDTDYSESYSRALDIEYTDLTNVEVYREDPEAFDEVIARLVKIRGQVGPDDWVVFDSMTSMWAGVQAWFTESLFGKDIGDYFMEVRKEKERLHKDAKALGAFEGFMDWPVINKQYQKLHRELAKMPCHLYMTAEQTALGKDDSAEIRNLFGAYGVRPNGQKQLGFFPSTLILLTKKRGGVYCMTTVKDRNREDQEEAGMGNFMDDYMVKVAGWKRGVAKKAGGSDE